MTRATSALLVVAGTLLLVTWLAAPATSAPQAVRRAVPADAVPPPELEEIQAAVTRLTSRLESRVTAPEPTRDPFRFGANSARVTREPVAVPAPEATRVEEAVILWPTLVAILTSATDGTLQAAITDDDDTLHIVALGETVSALVVSEVAADAVTLTDPVSLRTRRLSIN